jgi:hypothetical protein
MRRQFKSQIAKTFLQLRFAGQVMREGKKQQRIGW